MAPLGARREKVNDFVEYVVPERTHGDIVLAPAITRTLYDISEEYKRAETLRRHKVPLRNRLLFCGPPGCGKTSVAEAFAYEVGLPLLVAKLDTVFGSLFGETAANLNKVFSAALAQPNVLLLDEFDALARTREDAAEHSEMRRIVNNLLLMIDNFKGRGFIVAATNLESTIDSAIFRRFDEIVLFEPPRLTDVRRLLRVRTRNFPADFDIAARAQQLVGMSHADIERICFTAIRRALLERRTSISEKHFDYALASEMNCTGFTGGHLV